MVWRDDGTRNVYGKVFQDGGWAPLPLAGLEPINTPGKAADNPEMTLGDNDAYVAFVEEGAGMDANLVVKRWNLPNPEPQ